MNRRPSVVIMAGLLVGVAGLCGCGQKGPLTLPSPAAAMATPATSATPAIPANSALPASSPPPSK